MKIMKIGLQGWHCPGKWNPAAAELEGESPGYSDQPVEGKKGDGTPSSLTEV